MQHATDLRSGRRPGYSSVIINPMRSIQNVASRECFMRLDAPFQGAICRNL